MLQICKTLSFFIALASAAACADPGAIVSTLQQCYEPPGSYELCFETLEHQRPIGDSLKGSPGISMRIYGRAQGKDVEVMSTHGGPDYPAHWLERNGDLECYAKRIDFSAVMRHMKAQKVQKGLEAHRDFVLRRLEVLEAENFEPQPPNRCDFITRENMVDVRREQDAEAHRRFAQGS